MKRSRDGILPQFELGPRLGGLKVLYQRSGVVMRTITMVSAMTSAWSTTPLVRSVFLNDALIFFLSTAIIGLLWMAFDYIFILPSEQRFRMGQAHRATRSPIKADTEKILKRMDE